MDKLETALVDGVISEKLQEIAIDGAEIALDSFLSDNIFKEIPFFGTLYKTSKAAIGIKDAIFAKTVYKFLIELKDILADKRKSFVNKLQAKEGFDKKVGEKLIVILDKLDDLDKPTLIGRLLKRVIEEKISFDDFSRISAVIQRAFLPDLLFLKKHRYVDSYRLGIKEHLMTLGLIRIELVEDRNAKFIKEMTSLGGGLVEAPQKITFELNSLGEQIRLFLLECA